MVDLVYGYVIANRRMFSVFVKPTLLYIENTKFMHSLCYVKDQLLYDYRKVDCILEIIDQLNLYKIVIAKYITIEIILISNTKFYNFWSSSCNSFTLCTFLQTRVVCKVCIRKKLS